MINRLYTARMIPYGRFVRNVWKITQKGEILAEVADNDDPPSHAFKYGKGWIKVGKSAKVELIEAWSQPRNYDEIAALVTQHGAKIASLYMGFDNLSFGDHYHRAEIRAFETWGRPYLDWLNQLAEFDGALLAWMKKNLGITRTSESLNYNLQMYSDTGQTFGKNPFLGFNIEVLLMGIYSIQPSINPTEWEKALRCIIGYFKPDLLDWFDGISLEEFCRAVDPKQQVKITFGDES